MPFDRYIAIDWSGAKGARQPGIAVAQCERGRVAPDIISPPDGGRWGRVAVLDWLRAEAITGRALIGFDFSFCFPYLDKTAYFPGDIGPDDVVGFWDLVETRAMADSHLYAGSFVKGDLAPHFLQTGKAPEAYERRLRVTEVDCAAQGLGRPESCFHLIGPSQVGLGSLAGMRLLKRIRNDIDIWPFDAVSNRSVIVEIYCGAFAAMAGVRRKIRDCDGLQPVLRCFESSPVSRAGAISDHEADAILSAAALRHLSGDPKYWNPAQLSDRVRRTEGWTFGVL